MTPLILTLVVAVFAAMAFVNLVPQKWIDEANKKAQPRCD